MGRIARPARTSAVVVQPSKCHERRMRSIGSAMAVMANTRKPSPFQGEGWEGMLSDSRWSLKRAQLCLATRIPSLALPLKGGGNTNHKRTRGRPLLAGPGAGPGGREDRLLPSNAIE